MSSLPQVLRQARIIAVPLTKPRNLGKLQTKGHQALTYYQFQFEAAKAPKKDEQPGSSSRWLPEGGLSNWASEKAASTWAGFGKAEGGWKLKLFQAGERLVDRMEFEELALKSFDPSLGPTVSKPTGNGSAEALGHNKDELPRIPLIYPSSINTSTNTLNELRALTEHRTPRHRRGFWMWAIIAPFTAPFMIIPIIPNIPFFFCVWRSWSHYKAYRSSQYLQSLVENGLVVPEPSEELNSIYKEFTPKATESDTTPVSSVEAANEKTDSQEKQTPSGSQHHSILLTREAVPAIIDLFGLKKTSTADLLRAVEQARVRVSTGRVGL